MAKPNVRKNGFEVTRTETQSHHERYQALEVRLLSPQKYSSRGAYDVLAKLCWQAHWKSDYSYDPSGWYGYRMELLTNRDFVDLERGYQLVRKVELALNVKNQGRQPELVIEMMQAFGWEWMQYDPRTAYHLPVWNILPPDYLAWMMNYKALGLESNPCGWVLEKDLDQAQSRMLEQVMKETDHRSAKSRLELASKWMAAGQPMECLSQTRRDLYAAPVVRKLEDLLLTPKEESERKAKAEAAREAEAECPADGGLEEVKI